MMSESFDERVTALVAEAEQEEAEIQAQWSDLLERFLDRAKMAIVPVFRKVEANQAIIGRAEKVKIVVPEQLGSPARLSVALGDPSESAKPGVAIISGDRSLSYAPAFETGTVRVAHKIGAEAPEDSRNVPVDQIDEAHVEAEVLKFLRKALRRLNGPTTKRPLVY